MGPEPHREASLFPRAAVDAVADVSAESVQQDP